MDRAADAGGQEEGHGLGGHQRSHRGAGGPGVLPAMAAGPGEAGPPGSHASTNHSLPTGWVGGWAELQGVFFFLPQPRKASATCSSATAAASSGLDDWSARSPRQRDSDPSHPDLTAAPPTNNKPPSPAGAALILSKPPSPCAPGNRTRTCAEVRLGFCLCP